MRKSFHASENRLLVSTTDDIPSETRRSREERQGPQLDLSPLDIVYQAFHSERATARLRAARSSCRIAQSAGTVRGIPRDGPKAY